MHVGLLVLTAGATVQALKGTRTVDRYKLVWSPRPEFVRMAARYGAAIVPFGAVGCEESVGAVMNAANTVRVAGALGRLQGRTPSEEEMAEFQRMRAVPARRGVNADKRFENELDVVRPLPPAPLHQHIFAVLPPNTHARSWESGVCMSVRLSQQCAFERLWLRSAPVSTLTRGDNMCIGGSPCTLRCCAAVLSAAAGRALLLPVRPRDRRAGRGVPGQGGSS